MHVDCGLKMKTKQMETNTTYHDAVISYWANVSFLSMVED